ncbi:MAG: hypothetical protein IPM14_01750 [bacterium]|nr:hypothetical protein [bacterium]
MARLEKKVLGELSGRIGDIVGRTRYGKYYISARPAKYRMSKAPHEVDKRNRFKVNGLFAKAIKERDVLYRIWDLKKAPASSAYNKICKVNFKLCGTERPTDKNLITPDGFPLPVESITFLPGKIEAELMPFDILPNEKRVVFILLASFYEPKKQELPYFSLKHITSYDLDELKLTFNLNSTDKQIADLYNKSTVFLAAVTEDANGNILRWSESVGREL